MTDVSRSTNIMYTCSVSGSGDRGCAQQVNQGAEGATKKHKDKKLAGLFTAFKRSPVV